MPDRRNILILTSKTGGGHVSLAEALRDRLEADFNIEIIDPQPSFVHLHYRLASRYALWLWSAEFRLTDSPRQALCAHRIFSLLVRKELISVLERVQPELIITTYPFLTYEVMQILTKHSPKIPFVMLFSDPNGVHNSWLTERNADAIFATSKETYAQALSVGFDPKRLYLVGWPVRAQFSQFSHVDAAGRAVPLIRLCLDPDRFTVFLQGGGEGAALFGQTVERVLQTSSEL